MPKKPNYNFEKRQREMAKQKKAEEKAQRKAQKSTENGGEGEEQTHEDGAPAAE
ncbi:MAG TPA: hypothetical protein VFF76_08545 [Holophagaceae bacterium]|jgi:hypothetical protein|nr:hypothetical protein [Holophagaceae bacterium]